MGGVALTWRDEHDAEREGARGDEVRVPVLTGAAGADETVLRASITVHARVGERVPVGLAIDEPRDLALEQIIQWGRHRFFVWTLTARGRQGSPVPGASTRTGSPMRTVPGTSTRA